jgi:ABC-type nickel/cobalt efflux system permease component RcnA
VASSTSTPSRRAADRHRHEHHLRETVANELHHHLHEIEEKGDSPVTALIVLAQVVAGLAAIVAAETTLAMAFSLGWL